jgi:Putative zinc-finger
MKVTRHLDEGTLQALLDGELPPGERAEAEAHVASCPPCAATLNELRALAERASGLLALADAAPSVARAQMAVRARHAATLHAQEAPAASTAPAGRDRFAQARGFGSEARRALLRAAVLVLGLAGVAAAAVPGVREWIGERVAPAREAPAREIPAAEVKHAPAPAPPAVPAREPTAVSASPDAGTVRVVLTGIAPGARVHTRLGAGEQAEVRLEGEAADGRFRHAPGRIEVVDAGAGTVRVTLPRGARAAFVEVNGRVHVAKEGARLRAVAAGVAGTPDEPVFQVRN